MEIIYSTHCLDDFDPDFKYANENDSHSWLINYPDRLKPDPNELKMSTMKETFTEKQIIRDFKKGKRKRLMEAFYRKIISEEVLKNFDAEEVVVEAYLTDYSENFIHPDDMVPPGETCSKNQKLKLEGKKVEKESKVDMLKTKYPLFASAPLSYAGQTTGRTDFKKNTTITKSPHENYDNKEY